MSETPAAWYKQQPADMATDKYLSDALDKLATARERIAKVEEELKKALAIYDHHRRLYHHVDARALLADVAHHDGEGESK